LCTDINPVYFSCVRTSIQFILVVYGHQSSLFILVVYGHQSSDPETDEVLFQRDMSNSQRYPLDYCLIKVNVLIYIQTILFVIKNVNLSGEWKLKIILSSEHETLFSGRKFRNFCHIWSNKGVSGLIQL